MRRIAVSKRMATESITKKIIVKGSNDIIPNYVAGVMDAMEGTYSWNYTLRNCPEEEWEELYKGKLGILEDENRRTPVLWPGQFRRCAIEDHKTG
jgi:hypothetical protein